MRDIIVGYLGLQKNHIKIRVITFYVHSITETNVQLPAALKARLVRQGLGKGKRFIQVLATGEDRGLLSEALLHLSVLAEIFIRREMGSRTKRSREKFLSRSQSRLVKT